MLDEKQIRILLSLPLCQLAKKVQRYKELVPSEIAMKLSDAGYSWSKDWSWSK